MRHALDIQTIASVLFVGTFVASECAAWQLQNYPSSTLVWQLNLGVFRAFEHARVGLHAPGLLFSPASLPVALTVLVVIVALRGLRCRLGVALFANLSFLGSVVLCYAVACDKLVHRAALSPAALVRDTQLPLVVGLLVTSLLACVVSHWSFLLAMSAEADEAPNGAARTDWTSRWRFDTGRGWSALVMRVLPSVRVERGGSAARPT